MGAQRQSRAVAIALYCYPKHWKARHGEEATELAQRLATDGVPAASIAFSYLGGAARARLAPLVTRRWRARAAALVATASIAAVSVAMSTASAPAGAAGVVRVEVTDRADAVADLTSSFRSHHFSIAVQEVPVPASQVGSIVAAWVTGPSASSRAVIGEIKGRCADGSKGCGVGLVIPDNFSGKATVLVGRRRCPPAITVKIRAGNKANSNEAGLSGRSC